MRINYTRAYHLTYCGLLSAKYKPNYSGLNIPNDTIEGWEQDCGDSMANALELLQSYALATEMAYPDSHNVATLPV